LAALLGALALALVLFIAAGEARSFWPALAALVALGGGTAVVGFLHTVLKGHFRAFEGVRALAVVLGGRGPEALPGRLAPPADDEAQRMRGAILEMAARWRAEHGHPDERLEAVLGAVGEGIVVITDQGQVSLVNGPAMARLGAHEVEVGTSVFAALSRAPLVAGMERARATGAPVSLPVELLAGGEIRITVVDLRDHGGAVLCFSGVAADERGWVDHDLRLHDRAPAPAPLTDETPLQELPVAVLDTETTGLDVNSDRIVSIGAVRLHGPQIYRRKVIDMLVNPGVPIPPRAVAVHGINDAMVAGAPPFADAVAELLPFIAGTVVVGHNIGFDLAMLRREAALAGLPWEEPPALDTLLLAMALDGAETDFNLEAVAQRLAVDVHGRHTALGDSLVSAEVYACLLPLLAERGVTTLEEARGFAEQARARLARQGVEAW